MTSDGLLQVLLYSEMPKAAETVNVEGTAKGTAIEVNLDNLDPYPLDEQEYVRVVRHIQANLLLSPKAVSELAAWLQGKLQEMNSREV